MNKKLMTIVAIVLLISTSMVAMMPSAEAKSIHDEFDTDVYNQRYMYYETVVMDKSFKIDTGTYTGGFLMFKGSAAKEIEVRNAIENGNIYDVSGIIVEFNDPIDAGSYVMVSNNRYVTYQTYDGYRWNYGGSIYLENTADASTQFISFQMSAGKGDSIKVTIDAKNSMGLGAYVITKALKNSMGSYYNPINTIKNNMNQVLAYDEDIGDKCTLEFTSDGVTDYYLVILIEDSNSRLIHHFTGSVEASGLSDTVNPMPFAIVVFIISIGLLAGVVYLGRKKIIE